MRMNRKWLSLGWIPALLALLQMLAAGTPSEQTKEPPRTPAQLTAVKTGETSVTLSWEEDPEATVYVVWVSGEPYDVSATNTLTVTGLQRATTYDFTVAAQYGPHDISPVSEPLRVTTDGLNLLANGSFEEQSEEGGRAKGWNYDGEGMSLTADPVSDGGWSHRIVSEGLKKGRYIAFYQKVAVQPGKAYVFEGDFLIKRMSGMRVQLYLDFFDAQNRWVGEGSKGLTAPTGGDYVTVSAEGIVPRDADYAFALVKVQAMEEQGAAWLSADRLWLRYADMTFQDNREPNNYMSNARPIQPGSPVSSYLSVSGDEDWFELKSGGHSVYDVRLSMPDRLDADLEIRNAGGRVIGVSSKGRGLPEALTVKAKPGQSLFIRIKGAYAEDYSSEPYQLTVQGRASDHTDLSQEPEIRFTATEEGERLRFLIEGEGLQPKHTVYLDTDGSRTTGMLNPRWPEAGMDYKIDHNRLYRYNPDAAGWAPLSYAGVELGADSAKLAVYKEEVSIRETSSVRVGYEGGDGTLVPQIGGKLISVKSHPSSAEPGTVYPKERFGPIDNPLMGWAPSSRGGDYKQPFQLVTASITWRDLEPRKGFFDWKGVDRKYDLSKWTDQGKRIVLRIITDLPTDDPKHMDIPDWLYEEMQAAEGKERAGTWYHGSSGSGFSPNYASTVMIAEHRRMMEEVARRWDSDPAVAYVQIGSLGHHGEFHSSLIDWFPPVSVTDQYVRHYADAFKHKELAMRKPFPIAAEYGMGLYNDMFGEMGSTATWLKWIQEGWYGIRSYVGPSANPEDVQKQSRMPDFWKSGYSAGEFSSNAPVTDYISEEQILSSLQQIRQSHTTWLGATSLSGLGAGRGLTEWEQANADLLLGAMGYRFVLESVTGIRPGLNHGGLHLTMHWNNKGVAPFYYNWKLELALADLQGGIVESTRTVVPADLREWLPGPRTVEAKMAIPENLPEGRYALVVGIIDPATDKPGLELAIQGKRPDGWHEITTVKR